MLLSRKLFYASLSDQQEACLENSSLFPVPSVDVEACSPRNTVEQVTQDRLSFLFCPGSVPLGKLEMNSTPVTKGCSR